jgi:hypothetical protein
VDRKVTQQISAYVDDFQLIDDDMKAMKKYM